MTQEMIDKASRAFCATCPMNGNCAYNGTCENVEKFGAMLAMGDEVRDKNVGTSDYSRHKIQPWDVWIEYKLNPFEADIVKRILRKKGEDSFEQRENRRLDIMKIQHICDEMLKNFDNIYPEEGER